MTAEKEEKHHIPSSWSLIRRFAHLVSALGVEGIFSSLFFIYLAWLDAAAYGEVMYAMAAGSVVLVVVRFGLYYPLVRDLGKSNRADKSYIISRVNVIKITLFIPAMMSVWIFTALRGFSPQMAWILFFICAGLGLEGIAETFFSDLRVRGRQNKESRYKIVSTILGYGYGFMAAFLGFDPVAISLFIMVSGVVRLICCLKEHMDAYSASILYRPEWRIIWGVFRVAVVFALIDNLGNLYNKTNIFFLESIAGVEAVGLYSATWNIVEPIAKLASEQFLGWVIFPVLSTLWWKKRNEVAGLVRVNALWLLAIAFPIMFFLHAESGLIIGFVYPDKYNDAIWMQRYLVWTIPFTFESNLFAHVMMVSGASKVLLVFACIGMVLNLVYNVTLVPELTLAGGCLVIVFTKMTMTFLTFLYCQIRFNFFRPVDIIYPVCIAGGALLLFWAIKELSYHSAVIIALGVYFAVLLKTGKSFLGRLPKTRSSSENHS